MPDNDIFAKKLKVGFRRPCSCIRSGRPIEDVIQACKSPLAKILKDNDGCPGFEAIATLIHDHCNYQFQLPPDNNYQNLLSQLRHIEGQTKSHRITQIAIDEAKYLCLNPMINVSSLKEAKTLLAGRIVVRLTDRELLSPIRYHLVHEVFGTLEAEKQWEANFKEKLATSSLAEDLAKDPRGQKMRVRRSPLHKRSTAEVLHQDIGFPFESRTAKPLHQPIGVVI